MSQPSAYRHPIFLVHCLKRENVISLKEISRRFHRINDPEKDAVWERSERKRVMGCVQLSRSLNARMNSLEVN